MFFFKYPNGEERFPSHNFIYTHSDTQEFIIRNSFLIIYRHKQFHVKSFQTFSLVKNDLSKLFLALTLIQRNCQDADEVFGRHAATREGGT